MSQDVTAREATRNAQRSGPVGRHHLGLRRPLPARDFPKTDDALSAARLRWLLPVGTEMASNAARAGGSNDARQDEVLIKLEEVGKVFLTEEMETHALSAIDLTIRRGEYVWIEGPSGSGKTTSSRYWDYWTHRRGADTSSAIGGVAAERPGAGVSSKSMHRIRISVLQPDRRSYGFRQRPLPLTYRGLPSTERRKRTEAALDRVGMSHRARHLPAQLSGGQQQRVAVARAIAGDPMVLLADEPTGNLDSKNGDAVMQLLGELHAGGATICMVTHNPEYAKRAAHRIDLFDGRAQEKMRNPTRTEKAEQR